MMRKIVIASDSFKGSVTSREVAAAAARGVRRACPECEVVEVAVADGGEGTVDALVPGIGGRFVVGEVHDPLMRPIRARYGVAGSTAIIEMAAASGLVLLAAGERNPLTATTYGTGELIRDALVRGCRDFLVGIGGSATNDGGMGMTRALGIRFLDAHGRDLQGIGSDLAAVSAVDLSGLMPEVAEARFTVACDVDNPFYGLSGAAHVFARQKGADDDMAACLDDGLRNFAGVVLRETGVDLQQIPGSGAGGGLAGAFATFLSAGLRPGIDMVLDAIGFREIIAGADLVITGEGRIDSQTAAGKAPAGVLRYAREQGIPVAALAGSVGEGADGLGFAAVLPIADPSVPLELAMDNAVARRNIERTVYRFLKAGAGEK